MPIFTLPFAMTPNPQTWPRDRRYLGLTMDGKVAMWHGVGKVLLMVARGKFKLTEVDDFSAEIEFYKVATYNPSDERRKLQNIVDYRVGVRREDGLFPFAYEDRGKDPNEDSWPCVIFYSRYMFDFDPMEFDPAISQDDTEDRIKREDRAKEARIYYGGGQLLTKKELLDQGVPLELFWKQK